MRKLIGLILVFLLACPLVWAGESRIDQLRVESQWTDTTPTVTPGDDDAFIKGTLEVDGACRFDAATITLGGIAYTLPTDNGDASEQLQTNGSGVLTWEAAGAGGGTLDQAYDSGGAGAGRTITADGGAVTINNTDADNNGNLVVNKSPSSAASGGGIEVTMGAFATGAGITFANSGSGYDLLGTGSTWGISATGTVYAPAIAAASSGNANLTIDAVGNGTITVAGTSTGNTIFSRAVVANGNVDIGNAATDTLTITSIIDGDVTLDDGTTDSPSLVLKDATDETATLVKTDGANLDLTTSATEGLRVMVGNLRVGNGSPGTAAMNGEDTYLEGQLEVDGTVQFDGAVTAASTLSVTGALATAAAVTHTLAAASLVIIDGDTTNQTQTAGALDINVGTTTAGTEAVNVKITSEMAGAGTVSGVLIDLDDDTTGASTLVGLNVDASDATGHASTVNYGAMFGNSLDTAVSITTGAAATGLTIDAATTDSTSTTGVVDLNYDTITTGASCVNIDMGVGDAGAGVTAYGILVDTDDDTSSNAATINGIAVTSSDIAGQAATVNRAFYTSGEDVALQADNGYVRIGTGSTPDVTPGDDDLFVEGTAEVDGALRADGGVTGPMIVYDDADGYTVVAADSGKVITNAAAGGATAATLPGAAAGLRYTFVVMAAQEFRITPASGDTMTSEGGASAEYVYNATVGGSLTIVAVDATNWITLSKVGTWAQQNP